MGECVEAYVVASGEIFWGGVKTAEEVNNLLVKPIDPESLRPKGRWTVIEGEDWNEDMIYQCSVCKEEFVTVDGTPAENLWNYCPNCGAKMEG